jgi:ABC-type Fe3+ transport system permease subunit
VPKYLTAAAVVLALWVAARSSQPWTGVLPAVVIVVLATVDYWLWERRNRPWHDWTVILLLLPAIFSAVWIGVGGLLLDVARSDSGRLVYEVGPGIGLVGLLCTLIAYHGRHHPFEGRSGAET